MSSPYSDDLFENTKMTFGEHLDELRGALIKAVLVAAIGIGGGLFAGNWVMRFIKQPIEESLRKYYGEQSARKFLEELENAGIKSPGTEREVERKVVELQHYPERVYVDPGEFVQSLKKLYPGKLDDLDIPARPANELPTEADLLPILTWHPLESHPQISLKALSAQEAFMIWFKAGCVAGLVLVSPAIFYFLWQFVAAGLYPHEKRLVHVYMPISIVLFLTGASLAFFVVFRFVLAFLFSFNASLGIDPDVRISEWMGFALLLPLGFGASFQLPLVMVFLERLGILTIQSYLAKWRIAVFIICILSAALTPGDPFSMLAMFLPLTALYFGGIAFCKYMPRGRPLLAGLEE